jgi:glutamine amidotransferase
MKSPDQIGYVIATQPLTDEYWTTFDEGVLVVFKAGEIVYA